MFAQTVCLPTGTCDKFLFGLFYDGATHQRHAGIPSCRVLFTPAIKITTTVSTYFVHSRLGTLSLRYVTTHFHDPFEQRPALAGAWKNFALILRALDTARANRSFGLAGTSPAIHLHRRQTCNSPPFSQG